MKGEMTPDEGKKQNEMTCPTCGRKVKEDQMHKSDKAGKKDFCYFCEGEVSDIGGMGPGAGKTSK